MKNFSCILFFSLILFSCSESDLISSEKTLVVASKKADCVGVDYQKCLLIKENETENWQYFYGSITGFTYQEGFEYVLLVSEKIIDNPPQDSSSKETILIKIISRTEKTSENLPI